jgi:hypothetical protein
MLMAHHQVELQVPKGHQQLVAYCHVVLQFLKGNPLLQGNHTTDNKQSIQERVERQMCRRTSLFVADADAREAETLVNL